MPGQELLAATQLAAGQLDRVPLGQTLCTDTNRAFRAAAAPERILILPQKQLFPPKYI